MRANIDACTLLTASDIQEVQGATFKDSKASENSNGALRVAQCYFTADPTNRSVSLSITQADRANSNARAAKEFWAQTFAAAGNEDKKSKAEEEKRESLRQQKRGEEEADPAAALKKIQGVGDEAYWAGNRVGGALYVLKKNVFIRLSVGGPGDEESRIEKSKKLAQKALDRL